MLGWSNYPHDAMVEGFYYDGCPRKACTTAGSWLGFVFRIITKSVCVVLSRSLLRSGLAQKFKPDLSTHATLNTLHD